MAKDMTRRAVPLAAGFALCLAAECFGASATSSPSVVWTQPEQSLQWKTVMYPSAEVALDWPAGAVAARITIDDGFGNATETNVTDTSAAWMDVLPAARLAEAAIRAGVKTALQVGIGPFDDTYAALKAGGMRVTRWDMSLQSGGKIPEAVAVASRDAFAARLAKSRDWLPDLLYFSDDYACAGALATFAAAGVRVPEDVRVATWANAGNTPIFAKELARTEMDPEGDAETVADALLAHLEGRPAAFPPTLGPVFREGATL